MLKHTVVKYDDTLYLYQILCNEDDVINEYQTQNNNIVFIYAMENFNLNALSPGHWEDLQIIRILFGRLYQLSSHCYKFDPSSSYIFYGGTEHSNAGCCELYYCCYDDSKVISTSSH